AEREFGALEMLLHLVEPLEQRRPVGDHQAGGAAQIARLAGREMELAHADVDPHDADAGVEERIAGEPQAADIIMGAEPLVGDVYVDVAEIDDVADIGRGAIEFLLWAGHGSGVLTAVPLVSRFRSSQTVAASSITNFGIKRDTSNF